MGRECVRVFRELYRWLSGDLAYETYLAHWRSHHALEGAEPLKRSEFFRERTLRRWRGVNRCC